MVRLRTGYTNTHTHSSHTHTQTRVKPYKYIENSNLKSSKIGYLQFYCTNETLRFRLEAGFAGEFSITIVARLISKGFCIF